MTKLRLSYKTILYIAVAAFVICALMIPKVKVNTDMTKYLPDDSRMRAGMAILEKEFDASALAAADVRIMMPLKDSARIQTICDSLSRLEEVNSVSFRTAEKFALFEISVSQSVDQKKFAKGIKKQYGEETVTQTSQDGSTPEPIVLILGVAVLFIILIIMSKSWMEPLLFLATTGMAVAVNVGTNAFLESVSITTNSIVGVLQLALSMDYSIILMNRYRQEKQRMSDKTKAMDSALKKAFPPIISSALTTIAGLLMLVFMRLKIGADMGFVLAKGVMCTLIYVYLALPGLILIFDDAITASVKKVPQFKTDGLAEFIEKFRIPLAVALVIIFAGSYYLHNNTVISFSSNTETDIDKVFEKKNPIVLLYDNADEDKVCSIIEKASQAPQVEMAVSYPSLMLKQLTAEQMTDMLKELAPDKAGMLNEDIMKLAYYARHNGDNGLKIGFLELVNFIKEQAADSTSMLASYLDEDMKNKMAMLDAVAAPEMEVFDGPSAPLGADPDIIKFSIREYARLVNAQQPGVWSDRLVAITDTANIRREMNVAELSSFMNTKPGQVKMVLQLGKKQAMTPLEFARFLYNDLFNRKALASFVNDTQKKQLKAWLDIMEYADNGALLTKEKVDAVVIGFGLKPVIDKEDEPVVDSLIVEQVVSMQEADTHQVADTLQAAESAIETVVDDNIVEEDPRTALFMDMISSGKKYTASQMSRNFKALGETIPPSMMSLLYSYYGCRKHYDNNWTMSLEDFVRFLSEDIMGNHAYSAFITDDMKAELSGMDRQMAEGVGKMKGSHHSIAAFVTDFPDESPSTEAFIRALDDDCREYFSRDWYLIGESVMFVEMKDGFSSEMLLVTLLTIAVIFLIVALTFRSALVALILVATVMSAVFINVTVSGIGGRTLYFVAYLIVQSILMGATIDYGILFTNYYKENHDLAAAYRGSIHTIMTSGLIIICVPGIMALLLNDAMVQPIVSSLAIGAIAAVAMILFVMPGLLASMKNFSISKSHIHRKV